MQKEKQRRVHVVKQVSGLMALRAQREADLGGPAVREQRPINKSGQKLAFFISFYCLGGKGRPIQQINDHCSTCADLFPPAWCPAASRRRPSGGGCIPWGRRSCRNAGGSRWSESPDNL